MRGLGSVTVLVFVGCASGPKPPAAAEGSRVRQAPPTLDASPPDSSPSESLESAMSAPPPPDPPLAATERRPTAAETRAYAARGGTIQPICMLGELACVVRYRDGGKRCSDKRDCVGECLYEGPDPPPPKAAGSCQRTSDPCGCKAPIHHGRVEPALCAD
jgi:hypothetical protein